jgi:hypothetical protein
MPNLTRVEVQGNNLALIIDDGRIIYCYPSQANIFIPRSPLGVTAASVTPPPPPPPDDGDDSTTLKTIPNSLSGTAVDGTVYTFNHTQLTRAGSVILGVAGIKGGDDAAILIALITAIVESSIQIYANTSHYPESANIPHDANGSDSDSVGIFQQRPSSGWGTVAQCMDPTSSTQRFIGGPTGPNHGSPRGLFDISGWASLDPGVAAQRVQVSAFPDRYANVVPVAQAIMNGLIAPKGGGSSGSATWRWPFQYSRWVTSDPLAQYGMRLDPVTHVYQLHAGLDFGAGGIAGLNIPAACAGTVSQSGYNSAQGNHVLLSHANNFQTAYFHMRDTPSVFVGQTVKIGQTLGVVGSTGQATGPHLHWETHTNGTPSNPRDFMRARGVPES